MQQKPRFNPAKPLPKWRQLPQDDIVDWQHDVLCEGQILWHDFYHECQMRALAAGREITVEMLLEVSQRVAQLPADR